jgi:hypothetical protein
LRSELELDTVKPMDHCKKSWHGDGVRGARSLLQPANDAHPADTGPGNAALLAVLSDIASSLKRLADKADPPPPEVVDTPYVAQKLGVTRTWIADQARAGQIPQSCVVPGTGNGRPWKFYRSKIEHWIENR